MSFIVAAVGRRPDPTLHTWLSQATAYAHFAGPDADGTQFWESGGLGHALLRIEPHDGAQPLGMHGRVWISADARLDDRTSVITALRSHGRQLHGDEEDAALLLGAYETWRERMVDHIAGDFAFA